MSSLSKLLAGRKKRVQYGITTHTAMKLYKKSKCKECGSLLSGKNPTNLASHLFRIHKPAYDLYKAKLNDETKKKLGLFKSDAAAGGSGSATAKPQTVPDCFQRKSWPTDSPEYQQRLKSIMSFLVDSAYPLTMLDRESFRRHRGPHPRPDTKMSASIPEVVTAMSPTFENDADTLGVVANPTFALEAACPSMTQISL